MPLQYPPTASALACTPFSAASAGKKGAMMESPSCPQKVPITMSAKMPGAEPAPTWLSLFLFRGPFKESYRALKGGEG